MTPQKAAGVRIEPEVSEPIANGTRPAATAEPGPLEEPPLQNFVFHGVRPGPVNDGVGVVVAHAARQLDHRELGHQDRTRLAQRSTTVASWSNICSRYGAAPHVVGTPLVASRSLAP